MKGLRHLLAVIFLLLAIFIVIGMLLPQDWQVEERVDIAAPPGAVFQQIATLRNWESWAVWFEHDPAMSRDYPGPESGQGSTYAWKGNKSVGEGTITVDRLDAGESIAFTLTMHDGRFVSHGEIQCRAAAGGPGNSAVVWRMDGSFGRDPFARYYRNPLQTAVGATLRECLENLKETTEAAAPVSPNEATTP